MRNCYTDRILNEDSTFHRAILMNTLQVTFDSLTHSLSNRRHVFMLVLGVCLFVFGIADLQAAEPERTRVHVLVTGEPEVGKVLTFSLHPFNDDYIYFLDFGDGNKQLANAKNRHVYRKPGDFNLQITVLNRIDTVDYQSFNLYIRPSVVASAPRPSGGFGSRPPVVMPREDEQGDESQVMIIDHGIWEEEPAENTGEPLMFAEVMPSFPGGEEALQRFLNRELDYPDEARDNQIEGKVVVQFVVEPDGRLSQMKIIQELGFGCEEAVMHTLARMPRWNPGQTGGQVLPVWYVLPITFKLL